jgi:hypothetical protein
MWAAPDTFEQTAQIILDHWKTGRLGSVRE